MFFIYIPFLVAFGCATILVTYAVHRAYMWLIKDYPHWGIVRTVWPSKNGYGIYCPLTSTIIDCGLKKDQATGIARRLNQSVSLQKRYESITVPSHHVPTSVD